MQDDSNARTERLVRGQRRGVAFVEGITGAQRSMTSIATRQPRLRAAGIVVTSGFALLLIRAIVLGDDTLLSTHAVVLALSVLTTVALFRVRFATDRALMMVEYGLFGGAAAFLATKFGVDILGAIRLGDETLTMMLHHQMMSSFFALIVIYGLIVPHPWPRTAALVLPVALAPFAVVWLIPATHPGSVEVAPRLVGPVATTGAIAYLILGALLSIYGSHVTHRLRREVTAARDIGSYRLEREIGAGGMGQVWRARHQLLARPAAVKLISPKVLTGMGEDPEVAIQRFETEAQATAQLESPHTINIYDYGTADDGTFYYVMELLDGLDFETLVKNHGPQPDARVVHLLRQACESLAEAHHHGMVHRDVKPANLFACHVGLQHDFVKVLDFGLVKVDDAAGDEGLTKVGVLGTPAYLAPEQGRADEALDGRCDLYALGCVGYWLLTGQLVFERSSFLEMAAAHLNEEPPPPSSRIETPIAPDLEAVILSCLAKDRAARPGDARELERRLAACRLEDTWDEERAAAWWSESRPDGSAGA